MEHKRILVIDDEMPVRYLIELQLRRQGYEVLSAKDGPSGLQAASEFKADLILLDDLMPGVDGFEVCQALRRNLSTAETPIIFLMANMTKAAKMRAFEAGADDYLLKPYEPDELTAHIEAVLRRSGKMTQTAEEPAQPAAGQITALYSPKGGVGTTTLAVQLSESLVIRQNKPLFLIDLDLPLGGIAPMLSLYTDRHVVDLLKLSQSQLTLQRITHFAQRHRSNLWVVPAPGRLLKLGQRPDPARLEFVLAVLVEAGYQVVLDLGSTMTNLTVTALRAANHSYIVTSGQPVANKLYDALLASASGLGLQARRLLPIVNELHGAVRDLKLARVPVARIPHASETSRTRMWLRDQGMQKLVSVAL